MRTLIKIAVVLVILAAAGGGIYYYMNSAKGEAPGFRTVLVKRGDLVSIINATGTVEPEEVVDIGAQVAGVINTFGKDANGKPIDYNSPVEEGTVLAQIDDSLYAADVASAKAAKDQSQASLAQANASVVRANADLGQMQAKKEQAQRDWDRAQKLGAGEALAQTTYDSYKSAYEVAVANLAVGEATIVQAKGAVVQAQAAIAQAEALLQRAQRNLDYCTIKSPVKGVIVSRRVNIGQTVVSSLSAPSLFLLAKDLKRMQIWVAVNEADIGHIRPGQPVSFTVDEAPGETFHGEVIMTRLDASMTSNVVTYTVEVLTDNSSGKLLPYLTANVNFELDRRTAVLLVPNAALKWFPQPEQVAPEFRATLASYQPRTGEKPAAGATTGGGKPAPEAVAKADEKPANGEPADKAKTTPGVIWVLDGGLVRPIRVQAGLTDNTQTEPAGVVAVSGEGLTEGLEVVLSEQVRAAATATTTNPFTPQFRGGGTKSGGGTGTSGGSSGGSSGGRS